MLLLMLVKKIVDVKSFSKLLETLTKLTTVYLFKSTCFRRELCSADENRTVFPQRATPFANGYVHVYSCEKSLWPVGASYVRSVVRTSSTLECRHVEYVCW